MTSARRANESICLFCPDDAKISVNSGDFFITPLLSNVKAISDEEDDAAAALVFFLGSSCVRSLY